MIGYALYYFVRKNFNTAMPSIEATFGITKTQLGIFLTLNGVIYGVSRFINGFIADRGERPQIHGAGPGALRARQHRVRVQRQNGPAHHGHGRRQRIHHGADDHHGFDPAAERLFPGHGRAARLAADDPLGPGQRTGDQDVDLEHVALDRRRSDFRAGGASRPPLRQQRMASLLPRSGGHFAHRRRCALSHAARQAVVGRTARAGNAGRTAGRRGEEGNHVGLRLPQGVPAPHGIRQPDHLGAGRHKLLRLHRPLLDARLGQ